MSGKKRGRPEKAIKDGKQMHVFLDAETAACVRVLARHSEQSASAFMRDMIAEYLVAYDSEIEEYADEIETEKLKIEGDIQKRVEKYMNN